MWWAERFALGLASSRHLGELGAAGWVGAVTDVEVGVCNARLRDELCHLIALLVGDERDYGAGVASACSTAGAVQIGLVFSWRIDVDDKGDVGDVDTAGSDIGGDEYRNAAVGKTLDGLGT